MSWKMGGQRDEHFYGIKVPSGRRGAKEGKKEREGGGGREKKVAEKSSFLARMTASCEKLGRGGAKILRLYSRHECHGERGEFYVVTNRRYDNVRPHSSITEAGNCA